MVPSRLMGKLGTCQSMHDDLFCRLHARGTSPWRNVKGEINGFAAFDFPLCRRYPANKPAGDDSAAAPHAFFSIRSSFGLYTVLGTHPLSVPTWFPKVYKITVFIFGKHEFIDAISCRGNTRIFFKYFRELKFVIISHRSRHL